MNINMKKGLIFLLTLLLPCFLFLEMWGSYRYHKLEKKISVLEKEQAAIIEQNKAVIAAISVSNSPKRVREIAEFNLGLVPRDNGEKSEVVIEGEGQ